MLQTLDSYELAEWFAYEQVEPFGERAAYWQAGLIAALLANIHRKKGAKAMTAEDFMPKTFAPERDTLSPDAVVQVFKDLAELEANKDTAHGHS